MLDLREYRTRRVLLADYLPWAGLAAPGIVLNKDGSLQRTCRFRGPDLDSATDAELVAVCARLNNALKRLGSGWALFVEALRHEAAGYPECRFPDPVSFLVDRERRAMFETEGAHFESECFLTFAYLAPPERAERVHGLLYDRAGGRRGIDWREQLDAFRAETDRVTGLLEGVMREIAWLDDAETITYLHACVSTERHPVEVPLVPFYIDGLVADMPLVPGVEPMLGHSHLRTLTLRGFPDQTWPGLLDEMNRLPLAYRWVARWLPFDKPVALKEIERKRRHWYAKRKGIAALLRETLWGKESPLVDSDAENQAMDADAALQELGADYVAYGLFTATVTVWDEDQDRVADKVKSVGRVLRSRGFVVAEETLNAVDAWLSSLPGQCYANLRQPPVSSLNLVHMVPLSSVWAGPERNEHLDGPEPGDPVRRVQLANAAASVKPTRAGYVNAIQVYPYSDGALYQLYVAPVHVTDIALEPGEELKAVAAGDTTQWKIGDTESGSGATRQAHVLVKPVSADLPMNNIVIATDRRTYHVEAHPTRETYMAAVSWRYPQDEFVALRRQNAEAEARVNVAAAGGIDVSGLRFRYRISGDSPPWRPVQAFDDGHKVYIQFPPGIAQGETPPLFIIGPTGEAELVNYRVKGSTYIVDRLFAAAELRLGSNPQQTVRISRTDGR